MNKTAIPKPTLTTAAQGLTPSTDALAWLAKAQADNIEFRIPVEVSITVLGVTGGALGFGHDRVNVKLNDAALGSGLKNRARSWFGPKVTSCGMWLWARWHDGTLIVSKAEGPIMPDEYSSATHIHVAA